MYRVDVSASANVSISKKSVSPRSGRVKSWRWGGKSEDITNSEHLSRRMGVYFELETRYSESAFPQLRYKEDAKGVGDRPTFRMT